MLFYLCYTQAPQYLILNVAKQSLMLNVKEKYFVSSKDTRLNVFRLTSYLIYVHYCGWSLDSANTLVKAPKRHNLCRLLKHVTDLQW